MLKSNLNQSNKRHFTYGLLTALMVSIFLISCDDQRVETITWTEYEPVYMSQEEFLEAVKLEGDVR